MVVRSLKWKQFTNLVMIHIICMCCGRGEDKAHYDFIWLRKVLSLEKLNSIVDDHKMMNIVHNKNGFTTNRQVMFNNASLSQSLPAYSLTSAYIAYGFCSYFKVEQLLGTRNNNAEKGYVSLYNHTSCIVSKLLSIRLAAIKLLSEQPRFIDCTLHIYFLSVRLNHRKLLSWVEN